MPRTVSLKLSEESFLVFEARLHDVGAQNRAISFARKRAMVQARIKWTQTPQRLPVKSNVPGQNAQRMTVLKCSFSWKLRSFRESSHSRIQKKCMKLEWDFHYMQEKKLWKWFETRRRLYSVQVPRELRRRLLKVAFFKRVFPTAKMAKKCACRACCLCCVRNRSNPNKIYACICGWWQTARENRPKWREVLRILLRPCCTDPKTDQPIVDIQRGCSYYVSIWAPLFKILNDFFDRLFGIF